MFFNFLLPPPVLLLSDIKPSEHSWFVTLQWGLCLLLESPKPLSVPPLFVARLGWGNLSESEYSTWTRRQTLVCRCQNSDFGFKRKFDILICGIPVIPQRSTTQKLQKTRAGYLCQYLLIHYCGEYKHFYFLMSPREKKKKEKREETEIPV